MKKCALALLSWLWIGALPVSGEEHLPPSGLYILKSNMMEGSLEFQGGGRYHAFIHLTQDELGHIAELEGPARIEGGRLVMKSLEDDGAELGITFSNGRATLKATEQAQALYCGTHATFDGIYVYASLDEIRRRAEAGDAAAQFNLGLMTEEGLGGLAANKAQAGEWYRRSAARGYAPAREKLKAKR
jgi:TPR repeat protein